MCTRTWIGAVLDDTGEGLKCTWSMIRRAGSETLETGIEIFPPRSRTWPAGPVGWACATTAVGTDVREVEPAVFFAVTTTRSVRSRSALVRTYVAAFAPTIAAQLPPTLSQRCHWIENVIGCLPAHVPTDAVSVCPTVGVPVIAGGAVLAGRAPTAAIARVAADVAFACPSVFLPWTRTRIAWPTSAPVSR